MHKSSGYFPTDVSAELVIDTATISYLNVFYFTTDCAQRVGYCNSSYRYRNNNYRQSEKAFNSPHFCNCNRYNVARREKFFLQKKF